MHALPALLVVNPEAFIEYGRAINYHEFFDT